MREERAKTPPLERYVTLLEFFLSVPEGLTLHELTNLSGLPKASLHRLLAVMQGVGLLEAAAGAGPRYVLGDRARRLVFLAAGNDFIEAVGRNQLKSLCEEFDETCYIARLEGLTVRSAAMSSPDHPWRGYVLPGKEMQHHTNASAKAIFAFQPENIRRQVLDLPRPRLTRFTNTDRRAVEAEYDEVRTRRFAICMEEVEEGLAAFAVPIDAPPHGVHYALATVGPKARILAMMDGGALSRFRQAALAIAAGMIRA